MKKLLIALAAVSLTLLAPAPSKTYAVGADIVDNYYSDNTYTNAVGWTENDMCDSTYDSGGTLTNYRFHERQGCAGGPGSYSSSCQEYNASTGTWQIVDCPDQTVTEMGRLRVPTGQS